MQLPPRAPSRDQWQGRGCTPVVSGQHEAPGKLSRVVKHEQVGRPPALALSTLMG